MPLFFSTLSDRALILARSLSLKAFSARAIASEGLFPREWLSLTRGTEFLGPFSLSLASAASLRVSTSSTRTAEASTLWAALGTLKGIDLIAWGAASVVLAGIWGALLDPTVLVVLLLTKIWAPGALDLVPLAIVVVGESLRLVFCPGDVLTLRL